MSMVWSDSYEKNLFLVFYSVTPLVVLTRNREILFFPSPRRARCTAERFATFVSSSRNFKSGIVFVQKKKKCLNRNKQKYEQRNVRRLRGPPWRTEKILRRPSSTKNESMFRVEGGFRNSFYVLNIFGGFWTLGGPLIHGFGARGDRTDCLWVGHPRAPDIIMIMLMYYSDKTRQKKKKNRISCGRFKFGTIFHRHILIYYHCTFFKTTFARHEKRRLVSTAYTSYILCVYFLFCCFNPRRHAFRTTDVWKFIKTGAPSTRRKYD